MNKNQIIKIIVGLVIIVVIAVVFFMTRPDEAPTAAYIVESDDGAVQLEISRSALPEGISNSDISVTSVPKDELLFKFKQANGEEMIAYELKPDGIEFKEDILFKATLDNAGNAIPMLFQVIGGNAIDHINNMEVEMDLATNRTTVSASISHFSGMYIGFVPSASVQKSAEMLLSAEAEIPDTFVGETAVGQAIITKQSNVIEVVDKENRGWRTVLDTLTISGELSGGAGLTPQSDIPNRPPSTAFSGNTYTIPTSDYICRDPGPTQIRFKVNLKWTQTTTYYGKVLGIKISSGNKDSDTYNIPITIVAPFECKLAAGTDTTGVDVTESEESVTTGGTDDISQEATKLGEILEVGSADPARVECPDAKYLSPDRGGVSVDVFKLKDGKCYPVRQFGQSSSPDLCTEVHYHTQLTSLGGTVRPDVGECGAAMQSDIVKSAAIYLEADR